MERETSTDRVAAIRVPNSPRIDRMSGFPRAARAIAVAALVVLGGSTFLASAAAESHQSSPPSPNVLSGQHGPELVIGDASVDRIDSLFLEYDPSYLEQFAARLRRFDALAERLFARAEDGHDTRCSGQIFLEAKWLLNYTARWSRIDARLDDLEASFAVADQSFAGGPSPRDGFYGRCATEMFIRIETTLVHYFELALRGELPLIEREPLEMARDPEKMTAYFEARLISDIPATGEGFRSRLGGLASILAAADRRDPVMELVRSTARGPDLPPERQDELRAHFNRLVDWWQDPRSGYWGAWYRDGERVFKTTDLSITYHIVHARRGRVRNWPELIDTTFAIREHAYPFGWLSDGHWTNHNNYDLARLFRYGWAHMSDHQRREAARTMQDMLSWSFKETVPPDYRGFHPNPRLASSLGAEFYFGASFLVAAGFFDAEPWYGAIERPAAPRDVCLGMIAYGGTLDGPLAVGALSKLEAACEPHLH
jgi:hypothetical protein